MLMRIIMIKNAWNYNRIKLMLCCTVAMLQCFQSLLVWYEEEHPACKNHIPAFYKGFSIGKYSHGKLGQLDKSPSVHVFHIH